MLIGSAPSSGITTGFIKSLKPIPKTIPIVRLPIQLLGRTKPIERHEVREYHAHKSTSAALNHGGPATSMMRKARIPTGPNSRSIAAKRSSEGEAVPLAPATLPETVE